MIYYHVLFFQVITLLKTNVNCLEEQLNWLKDDLERKTLLHKHTPSKSKSTSSNEKTPKKTVKQWTVFCQTDMGLNRMSTSSQTDTICLSHRCTDECEKNTCKSPVNSQSNWCQTSFIEASDNHMVTSPSNTSSQLDSQLRYLKYIL